MVRSALPLAAVALALAAEDSKVRWTGVNIVGFDYGHLGIASGAWCSDEDCDTGGWSDSRLPEDTLCPGYGGNKAPTYKPVKICSGYSDVPDHYNGGFGAPRDFEGVNFGTGGGATSVSIPVYARASPLMDEVRGAVEYGMNTFRLPFRMEYVAELWRGTWMEHARPDYVPPFPHYLQMVVDFMESILAGTPPSGSPPISVIFDMHNYFRWCPMGIGGTFSCLEEAGYDTEIKYHKTSTSSCPFSGVFPADSACPKSPTSEQTKNYWDSPPTFSNFTGTPDYGIGDALTAWSCPLDDMSPPSQSRWETCGLNSNAPPGDSSKQNPYAKVLSQDCFVRIWEKLLQLPVSSKAFPDQCMPLYQVLNHYSDESKNCVHIGLMNEPNMVDTEHLADAYRRLVTSIRSAPFNLTNRLLVEGNYWGGLHAQVDPTDRSTTPCGAPGATGEGHTAAGKMPLQIIHEALSTVKNLGKWTYGAHQYFDFFSTGNYDCGHGWNACDEGTEEQVKAFTNWDAFIGYCAKHDISIAISEFGAHATQRCSRWMDSFLSVLQKNAYKDGQGGVLLWTVWRTCPHTSWYGGMADPDSNPSSDCIQFAAPQSWDSQEYSNLWRVTSDPSLPYGLKHVMAKYVYGGRPAPTPVPTPVPVPTPTPAPVPPTPPTPAGTCPCAGCPTEGQELPYGGACCHGGQAGVPCPEGHCRCEVQNWVPAQCTGALGVWCPASGDTTLV